MIAILYPLKMDKNLSEAYSSIYEELHPTVARNDAINKANAMKAAQANKVPQNVRDASRRQVTAGGPKDVGANKYTTADKKTIINYNKDKMNNSYEPEGEMIDEMSHKAPRMQKGAMAYDGPNKERSEAADRILAKTKAKRKKMKEEVEQIDELKKKTMGSYIAKASKDLADRRFDQGDSEKRKYEPDEADEKEDKKLDKREEGIARAAKKITKEGRYRAEWEEMKLKEINDHRAKFDEWTESIVEEGYDIERWSDEELIDTFIDENGLWQSREGVLRALLSESDKKGKGSGKKDACYKKVKASAKVWPSAYASGRLVQCRKKGAANYGNKSEEMSDWRSEFIWEDEVKEGIVGGPVGVHIAKNHSYPARAAKLTVTNKGNKPAV